MNIHLRQLRSCEKVLQVNFPERYTNLSINIYFLIHYFHVLKITSSRGSRYSSMDQVKFVEDSL